ncbi:MULTISPECIES: hypothetical protein [Bacillus]|uniref:hypothetical protein n=1 Tax=Bacillus TaxID=1386 RepID=UPI0022437490|nr:MULTISPECIES: hypothetical protein [Bacillus]MDN5389798.1 hypothetical protein [Bacillus sp. LB7]MEC1023952.1 hypothetical protein [Bacillus paralicheniformis]MEC1024691.1 hypothetical protein [Bacillus paralicheniformis]MEC1034244.1 hypothetical protein [Bacillus paralicheniformis]MEC1051309.1 hypothetical protein [Bacillus paralicheniformis]
MKKTSQGTEETSNEFVIEDLRAKLDFVLNELEKQFKLRENELLELKKLEEKYSKLEKRYYSLRNSFLGRLTIKYWTFRRKLTKKK